MKRLYYILIFVFLMIGNIEIAGAKEKVYEFGYTGNYQKFTATFSGVYKFEVWGAQGGQGESNSLGGKGAYASGYYQLNAGQSVYIYVGGAGLNGSTIQAGGFNGGGSSSIGKNKRLSGSGGGATDIRTLINEDGTWSDKDSLMSRIIVAGGGGGGGGHYSYPSYDMSGGAAGALEGASGKSTFGVVYQGTGGTQTAGGFSKYSDAVVAATKGGLGYGGNGSSADSSGSGGGGGYYGGGGGYCSGAGGGSSFIESLLSYDSDEPIAISGNQYMPTHDGVGTMNGNSGDGYAKITLYSLFSDLEIEGLELVSNLDNPFVYHVTLPAESYETKISSLHNNFIWSNGLGNVTLESGKTHEIVLMIDDGTVLVYNIIPNYGIAKIDSITWESTPINFHSNVYEYNLTVDNSVGEFNPTIVVSDGVQYKISNSKLNVGNNDVEITVSKDGAQSTIYHFHINRLFQGFVQTFDYIGDYQEFVAQETGIYKLEVWGAQGGQGEAPSPGGKGGYSKGYYSLNKGDKLYVYVGGAGKSGIDSIAGGYNGGGKNAVGEDKKLSGSGGGATDIRTSISSDGAWNDATSLASRIIVAGGGGGGGGHYTKPTTDNLGGGAGGGLTGEKGKGTFGPLYPGTGGTQTAGGYASYQSTDKANTSGKLGIGGNGTSISSSGAGGGGGYFGGGGGDCSGGGGGSSYIDGLLTYNDDVPNTIMGTDSLPTLDGTDTMIGNSGNGFAKITYMSDEIDTLVEIKVNGTLVPDFDVTKKEYDINLGMDETKLTISTKTEKGKAFITGTGTFEVSAGPTDYAISMTNLNGTVTTYVLHVVRQASPSALIKEFKVNGSTYTCTDETPEQTQITCSVIVPTDVTKINLELIKQYPSQTVPTDTIYDFTGSNLEKTITVWNEGNTSNQVYQFNFIRKKSTILKSLTIQSGGILVDDFNPTKMDYVVNMLMNSRELNIQAESWFEDAKITIDEARYIGVDDKLVTIKVELDGVPTSIYNLNIHRLEDVLENIEYGFSYTGNYQEFIAPANGTYKFEVWGAQGGKGEAPSPGGKGGYSRGYYHLNALEKVYIYVGGVGKSGNSTLSGGFNGGGKNAVGEDKRFSGSGGGATDIRTTIASNGAWDDENSLASRIIVAGGGGGGGGHYTMPTTGNLSGGAGGGLTGEKGKSSFGSLYPGTGGTQTAGGYASHFTSDKVNTLGKFGIGGNGTSISSSGAGGGGGYFGGGGGDCGGGGGGSSYIGALSSCNGDEPITIMGTSSMPTHDGNSTMVGNSGDGYAKITPISVVNGDAFLDNLVVKLKGTNENLITDFAPWTYTYQVDIEDNIDIEIEASPKDKKSIIMGTGVYEVAPGKTEYKIKVTSVGGEEKEYIIHINRNASNDKTLENILFKSSHSYLCGSLCKYTFDSKTPLYDIIVPFQTETVTLQAVPRSKWQNVVYRIVDGDTKTEVTDTTFTLNNGINVFEIEVTSEDKSASMIYTYKIQKDNTSNNNLASLVVTAPSDVNLSFDENANIYEYSITIPSNSSSLTIEAKPQNPNAEVYGENNLLTSDSNGVNTYTFDDLTVGLNECLLTVKANGNSKTYILHVYKELGSNNYLSNLTITDHENKTIDISPIFNKNIFSYTANASSLVEHVAIQPILEDEINSTMTIDSVTEGVIKLENGNYQLVSGNNDFEISVLSQDGKVQIYELTIMKAKSNNSNLANIEVKGYSLTPEFSSDVKKYSITVPSSVMSVDVTVTPEEKTATYTIKGDGNLIHDINTIVITSIAEDKSYQIYEITVKKQSSENNYLSSIEVTGGTLNEAFDREKTDYTMNVDANVSSIDVFGKAEDSKAVIKGNGTYSLAKGDNTISLKVVSESGDERVYTIKVTRAKNSDVTLKEVKNNQNSEVIKPEDSTLGYDYLINVQYEVNEIEITGIPNSSSSIVTGNKKYSLKTGNNDIHLSVTAEDKTTASYVVRVVRDKSSNDDLDFLYVEEGGLNPIFHETTIYYDVKVPNDKNTLHIEAITEDKEASYEVIDGIYDAANGIYTYDIRGLKEDESINVVVRVYAEKYKETKEKYKDYILKVTKQKATSENLSLTSLETNRGEVSPTFGADTLNYTLEVENNVKDITITGIPFVDNVKVEGSGTYSLNVGKNAIPVFVIGESGVQRDYQIVVTRKKSKDATLASLVVKGHVLTPSFGSSKDSYTLKTSLESLEFTTIKPTENEATYEVIGNENFVTGENIVTIRVTAPDGETTKDYQIIVTKEGSKNNNLAKLEVEGYTLVPTFHKGVTFYAVEVENHINSIVINASAEDSNASISGIGLQTIETGENYFDVVVTSEANTTKTYTILVTKEASDNNYLASLISDVGEWNEEFDKTKNSYQISVPYETTEIELFGDLEDANASVTGLGKYALEVGEKKISIIVVSESGVINTYEITITRESAKSVYLTKLEVKDYDLDTTFNKELFEYYITVNNETTELELNYETEDKNAIVVVTGNKDFNIGMNEVHIKVKRVISETETLENDYVLYVNRQMSTNNYLSSLTVSEGTISPIFEPQTLEYKVDVERNIDKIIITASTEDKSATITSGIGEHTLELGENIISIKVKSSIGITRTYKIVVNRKKSDNAFLKDLSVLKFNVDLISGFDKTVNTYNAVVTADVNFVQIKASTEDEFASVQGTGMQQLKTGLNKFKVEVIAENGNSNIYEINITKEVSSNNYLSDLIPSAGTLNPEFDKETLEYTLNLANDVDELCFEATAESEAAQIVGIDSQSVSQGTNIRNVVVTAEDGKIRTYTIKVIKESAAEAKLSNLVIAGYEFTFNPDTFSYDLKVSESKRKLLASEITATPKDSEATVNLMGDLELENGMINIYTIEVIAKDGYTTQEYTLNITRDSEEYTLTSSVYEIVRSDDFDYVIGILPNTKISEFQLNFQNEQSMLHVYREDGNLISDSDTLVGTGMIIKLESTDYVYDELRIIVRGDLTKDGKVNGADQVKLINYVGKASSLDSYQSLAADLTKDGKINGADQVKLINYVGKSITEIN